MLSGPLLPTLLRLATPNIIGLFATTLVIGYDGFILGRHGADALAGVALVFPLSMLMLQMSAGGIGGATTAVVARALGAGRRDDAERLAQQAVLVACAMATLFTLVMLGPGQRAYALMGGRGADPPELVAKAVLQASTAANPSRRYTAGRFARQVSLLRRFVPASAFDRSLRKQFRLPVNA
jgi:Na+-driven multidrug efflux pump